MSQLEIVQLIGTILTKLDMLLASPDLPQSSADWQLLYALRKRLDDQQRELVKDIFNQDTEEFKDLTQQLQTANKALQQVINDISKIATIIGYVSSIAAVADRLLAAAK
jgi:uncharacterized membrane-anchored protein YhcB (DUF1043 family)